MQDFADHPARAVSIRSMTAVEAGDRAAWLAVFAEDAVVADPIGPSPLDPSGAGHHGPDAIAAFWDNVIAGNQIRFTIRRSYAAGSEVANVGTITTTFPSGEAVAVDGVFTYRVDDAGERLAALRAFWEFDAAYAVPAPGL
ncbi:MAG: nuclear transport factor 2 family protein [Actinobacteria bacterium]|nr:nuclear transport factor 2 family protein [Actinomycetota bacterium]